MKQLLGSSGLVRARRPAVVVGWGCFVFVLIGGYLRAAELPAPVTLDLPIAANVATPAWLGHPDSPKTAFATLNVPILTPDPAASLLVTVYFTEKQGGFMRVIWNGTQGAQLLSENFYEDIGMSNQRALVISSAMLVGDGTLEFQCGDSTLGIQRIKLEWLATKDALVSQAVKDQVVTPSVGASQLSAELNGQKSVPQPGAWQDQLVTVPITDAPLRIEQGVDFSVDLDKVPGTARLSLKETGLPLGKRIVVWVNQQRAGTITPAVPDLQDGGFLADDSAVTSYIGWRDGSFYVPVALLKEGVNTLQLSDEDDAPHATGAAEPTSTDTEKPLAIKSMVLQLNYFMPQAKAGFLQPQLSLLPTGPISPTDTTSTTTTTTNP